jgi:DNA repair protein RadC
MSTNDKLSSWPLIQIIQIGLVRDALPDTDRVNISKPSNVVPHLGHIKNSDKEHFVVLCLNARNQINTIETVSVGTLNASLVHPREVFKAAILQNSASIILAHNHPSDDVTPSREDLELNKRMVDAGEIMGIEVLDHLIVGPERFLSLKEAGVF